MLILDTNVVSDVMRNPVSGTAAIWLKEQDTEIMVTAISVAEILRGIGILPAGKRRKMIEDQFAAFLEQGFRRGVLPFDGGAARSYADLKSRRRDAGRPIAVFDAMIAAIALSVEADVATRDVDDFEGCGLRVLNPWA